MYEHTCATRKGDQVGRGVRGRPHAVRAPTARVAARGILYNPADGTHRVFKGIAGPQEISALTYRDGVVYGGSLGYCPSKQDGKVFALDVASGQKLWESVPIPGEHGVSGLAFDGQGRLFGVTAGKGFELDPATRQVLRTKEYVAWNWGPVIGFVPRAVNLAYDPNDGHLYGTAVGALLRIDPETMTNTAPGVEEQRPSLPPPPATAPARSTSCKPTVT